MTYEEFCKVTHVSTKDVTSEEYEEFVLPRYHDVVRNWNYTDSEKTSHLKFFGSEFEDAVTNPIDILLLSQSVHGSITSEEITSIKQKLKMSFLTLWLDGEIC